MVAHLFQICLLVAIRAAPRPVKAPDQFSLNPTLPDPDAELRLSVPDILDKEIFYPGQLVCH